MKQNANTHCRHTRRHTTTLPSALAHIALMTLTALVLWLHAAPSCAQTTTVDATDGTDGVRTQFVPVTSIDEMSDGSVVVIGSAAHSCLMSTTEERNRRKAVSVTFVNGRPTDIGSDVQLITLRRKSGGWRLDTSNGKCLAATASSTQALKTVSTSSDELTIANITISPSTGNADIVFRGNAAYNTVVRFSANSGGFFWCYSSVYSAKPVQLYRLATILPSLDLHADNPQDGTDDLNTCNGSNVDATTLHRHLLADGGWYTLCLPFALTAADINDVLRGAEVEELVALRRNTNGTATLVFKSVDATVAGRPYLIKMKEDVIDPVFRDKTIRATAPIATTLTLPGDQDHAKTTVTMQGIYSPTHLEGTGYRFLSADGTRLAVPNGGGSLRPYRAFFITDGGAERLQAIHNDSHTTSIATPHADLPSTTPLPVYDLQGRRLPHDSRRLLPSPNPSGRSTIVIVNGKKYSSKVEY